jgi:hypothetical protein
VPHVLLAQHPQLGLAFGRRQFAHRGGQKFVSHLRGDALGGEDVLRVVDRDTIE